MRADTPLKAIMCFDAVMRTGSATTAAQTLFVTPGAIGQQVRKLEEWLGVALFVRTVRRLQPTDEAHRYWEQVRPALQQIEQANALILGQGVAQVRLSLPPALANTWFARRMPELVKQHPDLHLHLNACADPVDIHSGVFDFAIRHFDGHDPSLDVELLLRDEVRVYCSPAYRERLKLFCPSEMPGATLLCTTSHAHWSCWLAQAGLSFDGMGRSLRFDQSELAIDAARRSQGLVLTSPWLVEDDLELGRLIQLFPYVLGTGKNYYLVSARGQQRNQPLKYFYDWLHSVAHQAKRPVDA